MLLFILKTAKQLVTTGVQPDIIESLDNGVREVHTTEQPEPIDTYRESDSDTDSGDENEHADQTVIISVITSWQNEASNPKND